MGIDYCSGYQTSFRLGFFSVILPKDGGFNCDFNRKGGIPSSMHSGNPIGLVVTGEVNIEKGIQGVAGDAINLASRLQGDLRLGTKIAS